MGFLTPPRYAIPPLVCPGIVFSLLSSFVFFMGMISLVTVRDLHFSLSRGKKSTYCYGEIVLNSLACILSIR